MRNHPISFIKLSSLKHFFVVMKNRLFHKPRERKLLCDLCCKGKVVVWCWVGLLGRCSCWKEEKLWKCFSGTQEKISLNWNCVLQLPEHGESTLFCFPSSSSSLFPLFLSTPPSLSTHFPFPVSPFFSILSSFLLFLHHPFLITFSLIYLFMCFFLFLYCLRVYCCI